jgi:CheY-like chemotaxis protein
MHGGTIVASSAGAGQGSSFTVHLPIAQARFEDRSQAERPAPDRQGAATPTTFRILLADDNEDFTASFAVLLRALGHEVRVTDDGEAALAAAADFAPDYAFLDIGLPLVNGCDLAQRLRAMPAWRNTVLVAVTGWGQDSDRQRSQEAGFDYHLVKPVELEQIREIFDKGGRK